MIFTSHDDGRVTVDRWDAEALFDKELLAAVPTENLTAFGSKADRIRIRVSNGWAYYRLDWPPPGGTAMVGKLLRSRLDPENHNTPDGPGLPSGVL